MTDANKTLTLQAEIADLEAKRAARPDWEHSDLLSEATRINSIILEKKGKLSETTAPPPAPAVPPAAQVLADVKMEQDLDAARQHLYRVLERAPQGSPRYQAALAQLEALVISTTPAPPPPQEFGWGDYGQALTNGSHVGPAVEPRMRDTVSLMGQAAGWTAAEAVAIAGELASLEASVQGKTITLRVGNDEVEQPMTLDYLPAVTLTDDEKYFVDLATDALDEDHIRRLAKMGAGKSEAVMRTLVRIGRRLHGG